MTCWPMSHASCVQTTLFMDVILIYMERECHLSMATCFIASIKELHFHILHFCLLLCILLYLHHFPIMCIPSNPFRWEMFLGLSYYADYWPAHVTIWTWILLPWASTICYYIFPVARVIWEKTTQTTPSYIYSSQICCLVTTSSKTPSNQTKHHQSHIMFMQTKISLSLLFLTYQSKGVR